MKLARTIEEVRDAVRTARMHGASIGFVPTMGFLHEGHLSLVDVARDAGANFVVVSIFVNPRQFGPNEDFTRYPRDEERDSALLEGANVDLLFLPDVDTMYPRGATTAISVGGVAAPLEGARRPGHFDGVATVVAKLFNIVQPDVAAFGRKDAQQCAVIERLVRDLDLPLRLVFGETIREHDGLAKSSRNSYLDASERAKAPVLHRALRAGEEAITHGIAEVAGIERLMHRVVEEEGGVEVDYLAVVDPSTFEAPADFERELLLAGAVKLGRTRLIDNIRVPRSA
ncbi:MAG: pantoate--beta-alanine ligase [Acidobacteria bacterium]|nr:pantoate--beta-alanine ligase [Acidobacteriota bacterium]MBV9475732.1 pantoate--beta-alanine ligase [Acidobacteriota bacterium]